MDSSELLGPAIVDPLELPVSVLMYLLMYGAGLLFWPVFQVFHRRWTPCARRLFLVFFITLVIGLGYSAWVFANWRRLTHDRSPLGELLIFPFLNLISLLVSTLVFRASRKTNDVT